MTTLVVWFLTEWLESGPFRLGQWCNCNRNHTESNVRFIRARKRMHWNARFIFVLISWGERNAFVSNRIICVSLQNSVTDSSKCHYLWRSSAISHQHFSFRIPSDRSPNLLLQNISHVTSTDRPSTDGINATGKVLHLKSSDIPPEFLRVRIVDGEGGLGGRWELLLEYLYNRIWCTSNKIMLRSHGAQLLSNQKTTPLNSQLPHGPPKKTSEAWLARMFANPPLWNWMSVSKQMVFRCNCRTIFWSE